MLQECGLAHNPIFIKNSKDTNEIRMEEFSSKTVMLMARSFRVEKMKFRENIWMNFPGFANKVK